MNIQTINVDSCAATGIAIGRRGSYDTQQIVFDLSALIAEYGNGSAALLILRPTDTTPYPATATQSGTELTWTVSATDTAIPGAGECELFWYVDGGLAKSVIYPLIITEDIIGTDVPAPPDPYETWIEELTALGAETLENAQNAAQSATAAAASETAAAQSATNAEEAAEEAASSEEAATSAKNDAISAKNSAESSKNAAGEYSASAATSAASAATSATNAATAAETATAKATQAASSAAAAATSAGSASDDAAIATAQANGAKASATTAAGSASTAIVKAGEAAASAVAAAISATHSLASASASSGSASAASEKATEAAASASAASGKATEAANSATAAQTAQTGAEAAQAAAEAAAESVEESAEQIAQNTADIEDLDDDVSELKNAIGQYKGINTYFPVLVRGGANVSTGQMIPAPSVMNRLIATEYIDTAIFDTAVIDSAVQVYFIYYDDSKAWAGNSGNWKSGLDYQLDTTHKYVRILVKKSDGTDFATIPTNAVGFNSTTKEHLLKKTYDEVNDALYGVWYGNSTYNAILANTVRWFLPNTTPDGWLDNIVIKDSLAVGSVSVELWESAGTSITRYAKYDFNVNSGNNILPIKAHIKEDTYISFIIAAQIMRANNAGSGKLYIVRDKTSTTLNLSAFETFSNYDAAIDVYLYSIHADPNQVQHTYTIGETDNVAAVITEAMKYRDSVVYIEPYEHDCIAEWEAFYGATYFSGMSTGRGLELGNNVHIIGRSGHKLKCWYTGSNDYVMANFSLFNNSLNGIGYTLENICIDTKKIRYCIHDERSSDLVPYKVRYARCIMSQDMTGSTWDHSRACIGGGLGSYGDVTVEDCIFRTVTSAQNMDSLAYHNGSGDKCDSSIVIKNCYCTGDSTLQLASYGTSTKKTKVIVANCSFGSPIEILDWTGGTPNFEIYQINNEVRT